MDDLEIIDKFLKNMQPIENESIKQTKKKLKMQQIKNELWIIKKQASSHLHSLYVFCHLPFFAKWVRAFILP